MTVMDACALLGRSRRQIYRYLESRQLEPKGRLGQELLVDADSLSRIAAGARSNRPLPAGFQSHFPEYRVRDLHPSRDRTVVLSRLLEHGTYEDLRWMCRRYSRATLRAFVKGEGARLLSKRSANFWGVIFGVKSAAPSGRDLGLDPWRKRI
ncbi:MAG: hypothetical protein V1495_05370 [Pseudomonadota bacterium]